MIGLLDEPYYWWNAGAMFDTLIKYWHLTGDSKYNNIVSQALLYQRGQDDYLPVNQTKSLGNDDQGVWALAALSAAEYNLPEDGTSWSTLAENVFNEQVLRWDTATCDGGLRWQIYTFNAGYDYKNSLSNGHFFQLSSRLARYTGNTTYSDWASKIYNWTTSIGLIDDKFDVFNGMPTENDCSPINRVQFSFTAGLYIAGAANLYNITAGDEQMKWKKTLDGLLNLTLSVFFPDGIASEIACENIGTCTTDMKSYKGLLAQNLASTILVAPYTHGTIMPLLESSAEAAAKACQDSDCDFVWNTKKSLTVRGTQNATENGVLGSQLSALSFVQGLLISNAAPPSTKAASGNSTTPGDSATPSGTGTPSSSPSSSGSPSAIVDAGNAGTALKGSEAGMGIFAGLLGAFVYLLL